MWVRCFTRKAKELYKKKKDKEFYETANVLYTRKGMILYEKG